MRNLILICIFMKVGVMSGLVYDDNGIIPGAGATASALDVGKVVMEVISENIANQYTTKDADGGAYRAKRVALERQVVVGAGGGTSSRVVVGAVVKDVTPGMKVHSPGHPHADDEGNVEQSNVEVSQEMVRMMQYSRWVEAQYAVANASVKMVQNALALGR